MPFREHGLNKEPKLATTTLKVKLKLLLSESTKDLVLYQTISLRVEKTMNVFYYVKNL